MKASTWKRESGQWLVVSLNVPRQTEDKEEQDKADSELVKKIMDYYDELVSATP